MAEVRFRMNGETSAIDLEKLMFAEARAIERVTGKTFKEAIKDLKAGSMDSLQALVWITFKRTKPTIKFSDLDEVPFADVEVLDENDEPMKAPEEGEGEDPLEAGETPAETNF